MKIYSIHIRGLILGLSLLVFGTCGMYIGLNIGNIMFIFLFGLLTVGGLFVTTGIFADICHELEYYERNKNVLSFSMKSQTIAASLVFGSTLFAALFASDGNPARLASHSLLTLGVVLFLYLISLASILYGLYIIVFGIPESANRY